MTNKEDPGMSQDFMALCRPAINCQIDELLAGKFFYSNQEMLENPVLLQGKLSSACWQINTFFQTQRYFKA